MHEMGIVMQIIDIAVSAIPKTIQDPKIKQLNLKIGKLTAIVPQSLKFCFEIASKDTLLNGAVLNIEEIPIVAECKDCQHEWSIDEPVFKCPKCDSGSLNIISGREMNITSLELED